MGRLSLKSNVTEGEREQKAWPAKSLLPKNLAERKVGGGLRLESRVGTTRRPGAEERGRQRPRLFQNPFAPAVRVDADAAGRLMDLPLLDPRRRPTWARKRSRVCSNVPACACRTQTGTRHGAVPTAGALDAFERSNTGDHGALSLCPASTYRIRPARSASGHLSPA
jgi:hypothetical protein